MRRFTNSLAYRLKAGVLAFGLIGLVIGSMVGSNAMAFDLDWSGQFTTEFHYVRSYTMDSSDSGSVVDNSRVNAGGYYIKPGGSTDARFESLFLRLKPRLLVNDNITIKSEWWLGDPIFGFFGSAAPYSFDRRQYYSTQSRGSYISAQRVWAEVQTDFGTIQLGRAPLKWGLGIVWNPGDEMFDKYQSTGDVARLIGKFGSFTFAPGFILYSTGNSVGGACNIGVTAGGGANGTDLVTCTPTGSSGALADYSLVFKYESLEDEFEAGVNFIRRIAGANQDTGSGYVGPKGGVTLGVNYNTWDIYAKKKIGSFTFAGEAPIATGDIGGVSYRSFGLATETTWDATDHWGFKLKAGHAPGQPSFTGATPDAYKNFFFHPNYKLGLIMFNYQLANFAGPHTLNSQGTNESNQVSIYDNPIVNATYLAFGSVFTTNKWKFHGDLIWATAAESAEAGLGFFNTYSRSFVANAASSQGKALGTEFDLGTQFDWDDNLAFNFDFGFYFPGEFYKFTNVADRENATDTVFAGVAKVGIKF